MKEALESVKNLGTKKIAILGAAGVALLVGLIVMASTVSSGSLSPLYSNLSIEDSSKITAELDSKGVKYQLAGNGTTILVPGDQALKLRMSFAAQGLPSSGSITGYEIFDKDEKLGTSNFMQNMNQVRAMEGELARTIASMSQVKTARVHLVMPKRELFQKDKVQPTASIQLSMNGGTKLGQGEVAAIKYLVATAVPGLAPENITIVDTRGILLARGGGDPNDPAIYASNSQEFRSNVENQMRNRIEDLLERYVGMGNVKAQVTAEINFDRTVTNSELFDPEGQVARSIQSSTEKEASDEGAGSETVSVGNNLPNAQAGSNPGTTSRDNREKTDEVTNYEISKTTKNQVSETGKINKLSIAVMIDGTYTEDAKTGEMVYAERSPEEMKKLEEIVKSAAGYNAERGDIINVSSLKFSSEFTGKGQKQGTFDFIKEDFQSVIQILVMGLVSMMVILMVIRPLVKRALEVNAAQQLGLEGKSVPLLAGSGAVAQIAGPGGVAALPGGGGVPQIASAGGAGGQIGGIEYEDGEDGGISSISGIRGPSKSSSIKHINDLLENNPDEAVSIIRSWLYGEAAA